MKRSVRFVILLSILIPMTGLSQDVSQKTSQPTRKEMRQTRYTRQLDSMVNTFRFQFIPINMEWAPNGGVEYINNYYYYVALYGEYLQVPHPDCYRTGYLLQRNRQYSNGHLIKFKESAQRSGMESFIRGKRPQRSSPTPSSSLLIRLRVGRFWIWSQRQTSCNTTDRWSPTRSFPPIRIPHRSGIGNTPESPLPSRTVRSLKRFIPDVKERGASNGLEAPLLYYFTLVLLNKRRDINIWSLP